MNAYLAGMALVGRNVKSWDELLVQFSISSHVVMLVLAGRNHRPGTPVLK